MIIKGTCTEQDFVASQFLHLRPRPWLAVAGIIIICLALWALLRAPSIWFGAAFLYLVLWGLYIPFKAKRAFRQFKAMSEPTEIHVRDTGLFFKRTNGEGLVPWDEILKWRSNSKLVLLYPTSMVFYLVPAHFFDGAESYSAFIKIIQARVGNAT